MGKKFRIKIDAFVLIPGVFITICLLCGMIMIYLGITGTIKISEKSKDYEVTVGYLVDYSLYSKGSYDVSKKRRTSDTYSLIYNYKVNGQEYTISTDYGTSSIPKVGSTKEIKYNSNNPEEAIIDGNVSNSLLLLVGSLCTVISLYFTLGLLGFLQKVPKKLINIFMGLMCVVLSLGGLYVIVGNLSIKRIFEVYYYSFSAPLIAPILMIVCGIYVIIENLFFKKKSKKRKKVTNINLE